MKILIKIEMKAIGAKPGQVSPFKTNLKIIPSLFGRLLATTFKFPLDHLIYTDMWYFLMCPITNWVNNFRE